MLHRDKSHQATLNHAQVGFITFNQLHTFNYVKSRDITFNNVKSRQITLNHVQSGHVASKNH